VWRWQSRSWALPARRLAELLEPLDTDINGAHVSVEPRFHLFRYLDEQTFLFNKRKMAHGEHFGFSVSGVVGERLAIISSLDR
jgi:hypothetical protein